MIRPLRMTLLACLLFTVTGLVGCSGPSSVTSQELRRNWTPELDSVALGYEEHMNSRTRVRDNIKRQLLDDWANLWLENRNLRMNENVLP